MEMKRNAFPDKKSGDTFMSSFYKKENITVCAKQGGKLEGNSTRKLLKLLDSLELELSKLSPEIYLNSLPFLRTLRAFNLVVHRCFGAVLLDGWREAIGEFTLSYNGMTTWDGKPISITPKAHIVMVHVSQFLDRRGDGKGLGYFSEQSFESVHADYKLDWESVKLEIDHPDYLATFFDCFVRWNARHL
jgi:hypothetical protein